LVNALVDNLGESAASGAHAFPTAEAMASAPESFYRETVRAGYRSAYLPALALVWSAGLFEVEELGVQADLPDDEVASLLLALPGIGPYGAAHLMMLLGRHSRLILDSWTRPKYAKVNGSEGQRCDRGTTLSPLWEVQRARVLALPHAGLGARRATQCLLDSGEAILGG
jgi:3-methyladenine DNA glycosylase/8-oxoguanine DNA glycosylase